MTSALVHLLLNPRRKETNSRHRPGWTRPRAEGERRNRRRPENEKALLQIRPTLDLPDPSAIESAYSLVFWGGFNGDYDGRR